MSHTILRGAPSKSQLYLDTILDSIIKGNKCNRGIKKRDEVNLAEIIYYCMRQQLDGIYMVNGASGKKISYREILKYAVPIALSIRAKHKKDRIIVILMKNHQHMAAVFYGTLFADVIPLMVDPNSTVFEISHFIELVQPYMVFCDDDRYDDVVVAARQTAGVSDLIVVTASNETLLKEFSGEYWNNFNNFQVSDALADSTVLLIPTSGSSGLPKATVLAHNGLIAQLPIIWTHYDHFPRPTERALLLSSAQWVTHTVLMITCPVFGVSLVMTPENLSTHHVLDVIEKFRPTWSLFNPTFLMSLVMSGSTDQFSSLEAVIITGSPTIQNVVNVIKEKLPSTVHLGNGMGMTETHSFITMPAPGTSWQSNGKIANTLIYKIVDEDGLELDAYQRGELLIKSRLCIFRGYYKDEKAYRETVTPTGWYKTGDIFYRDDNDDVYFVERKKFWFKYLNYHIAPEELEMVIFSVPGVEQCVVCDSEKGPAAAIVSRADENSADIKGLIHSAIKETLSDYKYLRGGIFLVSSLPCTHSGKIKRKECSELVKKLLKTTNTNGY